MKSSLLKPTSDPVFKRIFGQEKEITIEVINLFVNLPKPVVDITFLQQEMLSDRMDGKLSVVDVRCTDSNKQHFILEMQVIKHDGFLNRQLLYACKAYALQFLSGVDYDVRHPVFLLTFIEHEILPELPYWIHPFSFVHELEPGIRSDDLQVKLIELGKRKKMSNFRMDNPTDRWMAFLSEPEKLINMAKFDISVYPNLMKAVELLDRSNYSVAQQIAYDNHLFAVADINQSRIESFDKGFEEGVQRTIAIIQEIKEGRLSHSAIAEKFNIDFKEVIRLADL